MAVPSKLARDFVARAVRAKYGDVSDGWIDGLLDANPEWDLQQEIERLSRATDAEANMERWAGVLDRRADELTKLCRGSRTDYRIWNAISTMQSVVAEIKAAREAAERRVCAYATP